MSQGQILFTRLNYQVGVSGELDFLPFHQREGESESERARDTEQG